jgi:hypothetical protein
VNRDKLIVFTIWLAASMVVSVSIAAIAYLVGEPVTTAQFLALWVLMLFSIRIGMNNE